MPNLIRITDRQYKISWNNPDNKDVKVVLYKDLAELKTLVASTTGNEALVNTGAGDNTISAGTGYDIRIINNTTPAEWSMAQPSPFDVIDDLELPYPAVTWTNDNGFVFQANGRCYNETDASAGSTACDLYLNNPAGSQVGRVSSKSPHAGVPEHFITKHSSYAPPYLKQDTVTGVLYWQCDYSRPFKATQGAGQSSSVNNPAVMHFITALRFPSVNAALHEHTLTSSFGVKIYFGTGALSNGLKFGNTQVGFDKALVDLNDGNVHIVEVLMSRSAANGLSRVRIDGHEKTVDFYVSAFGFGSVLFHGTTSSSQIMDVFSVDLKLSELVGAEYTAVINHHKQQAGLSV